MHTMKEIAKRAQDRSAAFTSRMDLGGSMSLLAAKTRSYDAVKVEIGNLDAACRGVDSPAKVAPPTAADLSNRVAARSRSLEDFTNGLKKPDPPPELPLSPREKKKGKKKK